MSLDVDLYGAAASIGRSYSWLQKNWRALVSDEGFPRPYIGGGASERPRWVSASIDAWKAARCGLPDFHLEQPSAPGPKTAAPANDPHPRVAHPGGRVSRLLAASGAGR